MLIIYKCKLCNNEIKKIFRDGDKEHPFLTCHCAGIMEKQLPDFGVTSLEIVDNGAMARKVELRRDAVQRFKERGDKFIKQMDNRDKVLKKDED